MIDLTKIPLNPGCYLMKDSSGGIIYIGKAKSLKKRVSQYFSSREKDPKTTALVSNIRDIEFIATDNEVEALLLERQLIQKNQPKYNIDLKDSKQYAYIQVTGEEFPRLMVARKRTKDGKFFGPFVSGLERDYVMQYLIKAFKIRTCKRLPKKACLRYHIGLCTAPCDGHIPKADYLNMIDKAERILAGKTDEVLSSMQSAMEKASKAQKYELALQLRDQIGAIMALSERQKIDRKRKGNEDIINYILVGDQVYLMLFNIYKGTLGDRSEFIFTLNPDFFEEFLMQYYSSHDIPHEIIVPEEVSESLAVVLSEQAGRKVAIEVPKQGEKKQLLDLVRKNIELTHLGNTAKITALQAKLKLPEPPEVIECFDISHLSGTAMVGSMVQFRNGIPDKSNYRRFKIRTVTGIDDFASIKEIVKRRYYRLRIEGQKMPDLVIIDGGKGQLSAALEGMDDIGVRLPTISIAKRLEEIYVPGLSFPIQLKRTEAALKYIQEIRDEAHRFAISYNRLLRSKKLKEH